MSIIIGIDIGDSSFLVAITSHAVMDVTTGDPGDKAGLLGFRKRAFINPADR
jgi:hypothetical protein